MKRLEIMVSGEKENEMARKIMQAAYQVMEKYDYEAASVSMRGTPQDGEIKIPEFVQAGRPARMVVRRRV